jgi:hypothetical protein
MKQGCGFLGGFRSVKNSFVALGLYGGLLGALAIGTAGTAHGADLKWSGQYRAEGIFLKNMTLSNASGVENSYILHHLVLSPEIIPTDGIKIKARFDIFNNALGNNQIGQILGNYTGNNASTGGQAQPPAVLTHNQQDESIIATELNMTWANEFSALVVGRVPFEFGLGMVYNPGRGAFDHYFSHKDLVAYKLTLGSNLTVMPAYGKVRESVLGPFASSNTSEDDINDYIILIDYNNPESDLSMGFLLDARVAPLNPNSPTRGNDFLASYLGGGAALYDGFQAYNMNFYAAKKYEKLNFGFELGFLNGYTGVKTAALERVELSGFGVAGELGYKMGNLTLDLKAGMAGGDDPDTPNFEGFFFSPNYDVAMMMFNYTLGQYDVTRSTLAGTRSAQNSSNTSIQALSGLDSEVISNAIYFSPGISYALGERYDLLARFTYATLSKAPVSTTLGTVGNSLGFETDLGLNYHPNDKFTWRTEIGLLFPGSAWRGTAVNNYPSDFAYGVTSKAAINF